MNNEHYQFDDVANKIKPAANIRRHNNITRKVWERLKLLELQYFGVVRDWTAIFGKQGTFIVLHHFVNDNPIEELFERDTGLCYSHLSLSGGLLGFLDDLSNMGFRIVVPEQAYIDALESEMLGVNDWHLDSPVHKLMFIVKRESVTLTVEIFGDDLPFPPYGVRETLPWPSLKLRQEGVQVELFSADSIMVHPVAAPYRYRGEQMFISDSVPHELLQDTDDAIARAFRENDLCVVPVSGGKDSSLVMQRCILYKMQNPLMRAQLVIVSADTGVDNPLMQGHVRKLKQAVEGLGMEIPFIIVEPRVQDRYFVMVFGRGYSTPSEPAHKWCVSRLKTSPGRDVLKQFVAGGLQVCQLLGLRSSESQSRSASIERHYEDEFYGSHIVSGIRTCAPIRNWSATDVVTYLVRNDPPWKGYGNHHLIQLYGSSSAGGLVECPIGIAIQSDNEAVRTCTGRAARMGCWSCTVVTEDHSLKNLSEGDYPELQPYYKMRQYLKASQDLRYGGMSGIKRDNRGRPRFEPGFGNLSLDMRTILLRRMKEQGIPLRDEEIREISKEVAKREITEGIALTMRFRKALYAFYSVDPLVPTMYDPLFNPTGMIDHRTEEDVQAIDRVMAMIESGEIIPYWAEGTN